MAEIIEIDKQEGNRILYEVISKKIDDKSILCKFGDIRIDGEHINTDIVYYDWYMELDKDMECRRKALIHEQEFQLIFFMNRDLSWYVKDKKKDVQMNKGHACIYMDNFNETSCIYEKEKDYIFKSFQLSNRYIEDILSGCNEEKVSKLKEKIYKDICKIPISPNMYKILSELDNANEYRGIIKNIYLQGKILELVAVCLQELLDMDVPEKQIILSNKEDIEAITKAKEIIDKRIIDTPNCTDLAKFINMSTSKFTKSFSKMYGLSVHQYVIEKRLENAAMLLAKENINISEAATLSGYNNMSHFSTSFKKKYGVLPRDFKA